MPTLHGLPAIRLRGNCQCADCLDPASGQRLADVADLAWLASYEPAAGPAADEPSAANHGADDRVQDAKRLWARPDGDHGMRVRP